MAEWPLANREGEQDCASVPINALNTYCIASDRVAAVLDTTTFDEEIATFTELKEVTEQAFAVRSGFILGSQFENMNVLRLNKLRVTSGTGPGVIARARFSRSHRQQSAHPAIEVPEITSSPHHLITTQSRGLPSFKMTGENIWSLLAPLLSS